MRTCSEIIELLEELNYRSAKELEDQDLDFKEWNFRSIDDSINLLVEMAICMANGGGGTVIFGIKDKVVGRAECIVGVPPEVDVNLLKKVAYDRTDPKLTPVFEEMIVPEGTGRLLIMQVYPGLPPYTDTSGRGKVRLGKDCQPLTGTLRRKIMIETGESDYTSVIVPGPAETHISPSAIEQLRDVAQREKAPEELLSLNNIDILNALGVIEQGSFTVAALLLAGSSVSIQKYLPGYLWTHLRMQDDTEYKDRMDGRDSIAVAMNRIMDRIMADNPITTVEYGLFHFEYRTYPEVALREALMNTFCHTDYRLSGPIMVKQFSNKLEINNIGGFIGGVSPENILHHTPIARNPRLVDALAKLRLVNRSNLGIQRMYSALLIEDKEPPIIEELGESIKVTFLAGTLSASFRAFVAEENKKGLLLPVDHLLILHYLLRHTEITTPEAARVCQRNETEAREILSRMERKFTYLDRGGTGRGTYWTLRPEIYKRIAHLDHSERNRRIDWDAAKTRILSILIEHAKRSEPGLNNQDIRQITSFDRFQVIRLMKELSAENPGIQKPGLGRNARYTYMEKIGDEM